MHLLVVMKKIYNFPEKSELPKFKLSVKLSWHIFSAISRPVEMKNLQKSCSFATRFHALGYAVRV